MYYPVWVSTTGKVSLRWGRPCDTPREAEGVGRSEVDAGRASLSFVVEFAGGERTPLSGWTYPRAARRVVRHWESLWDATDTPEDRP